MTTYEHAMLGVTGVLAAGLNRRHGWPLVALAAVAAISPDWDGLTIAAGPAVFAAGHRVWGHGVLACLVTGLLLGAADYRYDFVTRCGRFLAARLRLEIPGGPPPLRESHDYGGLAVWVGVAVLAALSHQLTDLVFSGSATLPAWELQPWWPLSRTAYTFPLVSWGDPSASLVFVAGMFAMWKWPRRLQPISLATLVGVAVYVGVRGAV